jgi:ABC-type antimicrobial peptide transport system permease subunit
MNKNEIKMKASKAVSSLKKFNDNKLKPKLKKVSSSIKNIDHEKVKNNLDKTTKTLESSLGLLVAVFAIIAFFKKK